VCAFCLLILLLTCMKSHSSSSSSSYKYKSSQQKNNKYGNNQYGNNYNSNKYSNSQFYNGARDFTVCENSVVKVSALYAVCDSPYTFYYGNGANRNSPVCNYGDKLSFEVSFQVVDDIQDDTIFVTMAVYDDQGNMLVSVNPVYLCDDLVGYECTSAGYYTFTYYRLRLPYPYDSSSAGNENQQSNEDAYSSSSSNSGRFLPRIQMAFSTKADSGYNLGALNLECQDWGEDNNYVSWIHNQPKRSPIESFFVDYGMLLASITMVLAVSAFVWHQASKVKVKEQNHVGVVENEMEGNYKSLGLMD